MNIMIASDIHGSVYYCDRMLQAFERDNADRLLLLGDLLYHGPRNDLPREYNPKENNPHGYMLLSDDVILWKDLDGNILHRHEI